MTDKWPRERGNVELLAPIVGAPVARRVLRQFSGLRQVLLADARELLACRGLGDRKLAALRSLPELAQLYVLRLVWLPLGQWVSRVQMIDQWALPAAKAKKEHFEALKRLLQLRLVTSLLCYI